MSKENKRAVFIAFCLGVLMSLGIIRNCTSSSQNATNDTITRIEYRYDTVLVEKTNYVPHYKEHFDTLYMPGTIDTIEVIKDYYTTRVFTDTLQDSLFTVILTDTIFNNTIKSRHWQGSVLAKNTIIEKEITIHPRMSLHAGVILSTSPQSQILAPVVTFSKKRYMVHLGYALNNKGVVFGGSWKVFER